MKMSIPPFLSKFKQPVLNIYTKKSPIIFPISNIVNWLSCSRNVCNTKPLKYSDDKELMVTDAEFNEVSERLYMHPGVGHNVLLIQPRLASGVNFEKKSTVELKLAEAVALVNTLPNWKVVDKIIVPVTSYSSKLLFGSGNIEKLKSIVGQNSSISAIFIGIDILTALQNSKLENKFKVQVLDRYQVILQIFKDHAHTKEAKLQLALAEIPYLRIKLAGFRHTNDSSTFSEIRHVGGEGETYMQVRRRLLNEREIKLKKQLEKIKSQRQFLRQSDMRKSYPIVAVVGYTNCGKTTLIKSFTNDERLKPEDKLFATLDVTLHPGYLPSKQKVFFIDTVGFISDVPTHLIQSFRSTLEEITVADLVVHIRDVSHPDADAQRETVLKTLKNLGLSEKLLNSIIEVNNKVDLLDKTTEVSRDSGVINISAKIGTGLPNLLEIIEEKLFENTELCATLLRIPNGGAEYSWLLREATIRDCIADTSDANFLIVEVVISSDNLARFKHQFGDMSISLENVINKLQ